MYGDYQRKPLKHVEDTFILKAHRLACAWMWPEEEDVATRTETEKQHALILRSLLVAGLKRIEEEGRNPMAVSLVSEVLPNANVMGLIYKRASSQISDEAITRTVGSLVMEQLYGPRDRLLVHLVDAEDSVNAYAYGQHIEALMRAEIAEGKNPLSKTAQQFGIQLVDMRAERVAAKREREERERLEAQTDAFAAGAPVEAAPAKAQQKNGMGGEPAGDGMGVPSEVMDRHGSIVDAALLG